MTSLSSKMLAMISQLREQRKKYVDYPVGTKALETIHKERNIKKATCYWLGFLRGVIASESVVQAELEPLIIHSNELLNYFHDDDAEELLAELEQQWPDASAEAEGIIKNILDVRLQEIDLEEGYNSINLFYGFLKGIACDNVITLKELKVFLNYLDSYPKLIEDPRILDIKLKTVAAMEDSIIDTEESDEICEWISRLVGDSFADTGLTRSTDSRLQNEILQEVSISDLKGSLVVITGTFQNYSRRTIKERLSALNVTVVNSISRKVDYLVVSQEASRYWATPNAGTKLLKAHKLRAEFDRPMLIGEDTLEPILENNL
jgi:NAD-dependent DNA ligase